VKVGRVPRVKTRVLLFENNLFWSVILYINHRKETPHRRSTFYNRSQSMLDVEPPTVGPVLARAVSITRFKDSLLFMQINNLFKCESLQSSFLAWTTGLNPRLQQVNIYDKTHWSRATLGYNKIQRFFPVISTRSLQPTAFLRFSI
jgi:hypothetical protein